NAPVGELREGFAQARDAKTCRGFMVGRTLFQEPSQRWLSGEIDDAGLIAAARHNFETLIDIWQAQRRQGQR
ncbi:MAG: 2-deoxy-5-keto-D-gluconate 6-phosphate aldolase domain-containing protein, partial [Vogesella sp.]|uniref:2-deoxy-5-keto-D-gluconate 6-phosphate aldolase domain-containing protein n=1 Tax=Vogesella sp. TaxID=1904252 RepID=UPI003F34B395